MRLVYTATNEPVKLGDAVKLDGKTVYVSHFVQPHKPSSSGKVLLKSRMQDLFGFELYVGSIGAEWIEREDREETPPASAAAL